MTLAAVRLHALTNGAPSTGNLIQSKDPQDNSPQGSGGPYVGPHYYPSSPGNDVNLPGRGGAITPFDPMQALSTFGGQLAHSAGKGLFDEYLNTPFGAGLTPITNGMKAFGVDPYNAFVHWLKGSGGGAPAVDTSATDISRVAAAGKGKNKSAPTTGTQPTAGGTDAYQQYLQGLVGAITKGNGGGDASYQQVQPTLIGDPFGKQGYQPQTGTENALLKDALEGQGNNYLGAFLPDAIKQAAQIYGPEIAAQLLSAQSQANTLQGYNTGVGQQLAQVPGLINQDYNNSIALQHTLDQGISKSLAGLNPHNAGLLPPGSPGAAGINAQNRESFNTAGAVLGGIGDLNASSLGAQRAAALQSAQELPYINSLAGRQALVANMIGNNSALAKIQTAEGTAALKLAQGQQGELDKRISRDIQLHGQLTNTDLRALGIETSIAGKNAAAIQDASKTNASNDISAQNAATARTNATTSRINAGLAVAKAMFPQATPAQQASQAKEADAFFGRTSGVNPRLASLPTPDPDHPGQYLTTGNNTIAKTNQAIGKLDYDAAVKQWAVRHGGTPEAYAQAQAYANTYYNYGQGDRPFDPQMQAALHQANLPTSFLQNPKVGSFITTAQAVALGNAGYKDFIRGLTPTQIKMDDAVNAGFITKEAADAAKAKTFTIWTIPPVK